jgi:ribonucleoside-diphosphate reductase alpha chain
MIFVTKRNGEKESLDVDKIHKVLEWACEDLSGVSVSDIEMRAHIQFYDGIKTSDINEITINAAEELISADSPNYQYVAARLMIFDLRKKVFGAFETKHLFDVVKRNVELGVYDKGLLDWYSLDDYEKMNGYIKHQRDFKLTAAAVKQIKDKYLIQDRSSKVFYETPQIAFLLIAATAFREYPKETRLSYVKDMYDAISTFKVSLPTPILGGLRSSTRQFSSCVLIDVGDDLNSISDATKAMTKYAAKRAGLGINGGRIRALGSKVGNGEIVHTGVVPFYRKFESSIKSCSQGGIRDSAATLYAPIWHKDIESVLVLKNNKGTHETRVRRLDYAIQWDSYLIRRAIRKEPITLFSPGEVPDLYEAFFDKDRSKFQSLYEEYEKSPHIKYKSVVNGRELLTSFLKEAQETGRIYAFLADNTNIHSPFKKKIYMSNLCLEIALPTEPIVNHVDCVSDDKGTVTFDGLVQLCTLGAINLGNLNYTDPTDMEKRMDLLVRFLNEILDYQDYQVPQARKATMRYRPLGIGVINYAYLLAKNGIKYYDQESHDLTHKIAEQMYYYALKASVNLAKERGAIPGIEDTIYSDGKLLIDSYNPEVDKVTNEPLHCDWNTLRQEVKQFGVYNATLLALMPAESSSFVSNSTNGIEPIRSLIVKKANKNSSFVQVVPEATKLKNQYTYLWDLGFDQYNGYIKNAAVFQKFVCQAISTNLSYNPEHYQDNKIPLEVLINHFLLCTKLGLKTRYYINTKGEKDHSEAIQNDLAAQESDDEGDGCAGGACKI